MIPKKRFETIQELKDFLYNSVESDGRSDLSGLEEEIILLKKDGKPFDLDKYQSFVRSLVSNLPEGKLEFDESLIGKSHLVKGGTSKIGSIKPETNTTLIEFAHKPSKTSHELYKQSNFLKNALKESTSDFDCCLLGYGLVPSMEWSDFWTYNAIIPYKSMSYSYDNMVSHKNIEHSKVVYGTASIHHNMGFQDPEAMTKYYQMVLMLQPTMISMMANSSLWNHKPAKYEGKEVLSYRSLMQLEYGKITLNGIKDYLYPEGILSKRLDFSQMLDILFDCPLHRTYVGGEKEYVGGLTMREYLNHGYKICNNLFFPEENSIDMMFRVPMTDVRMSLIENPRVETRCHDAISMEISIGIDAFYRGLKENIETAYDFIMSLDLLTLMDRRYSSAIYGLKTNIIHVCKSIKTQNDFSKVLLEISYDGLKKRNLNEEIFLGSIHRIIDSGKTHAEIVLDEMKKKSIFNIGKYYKC